MISNHSGSPRNAFFSTTNPPARFHIRFCWAGCVWQSTFPPDVSLDHALFLLSLDMRKSGLVALLAGASVAEAFLPAPVISNSATLRQSSCSSTSASNVGRQARTAQYMVAAPAKEDTLAAVPHGGTLVDLNAKTEEDKKVSYMSYVIVEWSGRNSFGVLNCCCRLYYENTDVLYCCTAWCFLHVQHTDRGTLSLVTTHASRPKLLVNSSHSILPHPLHHFPRRYCSEAPPVLQV